MEGVVVGNVKACEDLSEKLKKLAIDVGKGEDLCVVTNAPNVGSRTVGELSAPQIDPITSGTGSAFSRLLLHVLNRFYTTAFRPLGKNIIVALVGTDIGDITVAKRSVSGAVSEGMLMDSKAMGWSGGSVGNAVLLPDDLAPGAPAPASRPRQGGTGTGADEPASSAAADKKAAKEQAKAAAKAAREAKKAAKMAAKAPGGAEGDPSAGRGDP